MMDAYDTIESELVGIVPNEGLDDERGVTHTQCGIAMNIERALQEGGHLPKDDLRERIEHEISEYRSRPVYQKSAELHARLMHDLLCEVIGKDPHA